MGFRIAEAPYRPPNAPADGGDVAHRAAYLKEHALEALATVETEVLRRRRKKKAPQETLVLLESGLACSIVRPTAYFKSLSGQISRVRKGKSFLLFGDGRLTATKPISDGDLGRYLALCLRDPSLRGILPIGGPGPAFTPREQGDWLFAMLGQTPRFRAVPVALLDSIISGLTVLGALSPRLKAKAELARIGRYYATESMLVWDEASGRYLADATPSFGTETLREHYAQIIAGAPEQDLGAHRVF